MVDTLNSEYDELNINLNEFGDYLSDIVEFQRDGQPLNLGRYESANRFGVNFSSSINTLVELGTSQYFLQENSFDFTNGSPGTTVPIISIPTQNSPSAADPTAAALSSGNFQLRISEANAHRLRNNATFGSLNTKYNDLSNRPAGEKLVGLIFQVLAREYTFLDGNDQPLSINSYDVTSDSATFRIDSTFAGLISKDDKIVFKGVLTNGLDSGKTDGTDLLGNVKPRVYRVTNVVTSGTETAITIDLSGSGMTPIAGTNLTVSDADKATTRIGIQNTFTISKGRIII